MDAETLHAVEPVHATPAPTGARHPRLNLQSPLRAEGAFWPTLAAEEIT